MRMYVFEGTPDEISQVMKNLDPAKEAASPPSGKSDDEGQLKPAGGPGKFVTTDFARRVLTRLELSAPMKAVLKELYEADQTWVPSAALYEVSNYSVSQFAGLMGAFGRRMTHTDDYEQGAYFFDFRWNDESGAWDYRLPETVREALRLEKLI